MSATRITQSFWKYLTTALAAMLAVLLWCPYSYGGGSCMASAERSMLDPFPSKRTMLQGYLQKSCARSSRRMQDLTAPLGDEKREEQCREQLLVDAYLSTCLYFRDVLFPPAFEPCWSWAREHYQNCVDGNHKWFAPQK